MSPFIRRPTAAALGLLVPALVALAGCSSHSAADHPADPKPPASATAAALPAPRTEPAPAPTLSPAPHRGEVRIEAGPFTDRVSLKRLTLTDKPAVTGHLTITSDVSDVLALELRAAYYDSRGRLLGTGTFQYQEEGEDAQGDDHADGPRAASGGIDFTVPATHLTGTPAAAVVSLPVLVNE
ncbi:hypothetical protein [Streptomyces sp. NK08204]|uniref:hypothetical protein n=1 Tax=Streptomyces sp. NK08204 TaxID=2873260 RepID=UPI001CED8F3A|nr:hypothetical protein [Streptomyces sp. NK08204]